MRLQMRLILGLAALLFVVVPASKAQEGHSGDAAATYDWVRSNAAPGQCGCFGLNGGGLSGSWNVHGPWSVVADFSSVYTNSVPPAGNSLTLTSFLAGARYYFPQLPMRGAHHPRLFGQALVGAAHAGGGVAGIGDATYGFASRVGGGIDVPVSSHFSVRAIQLDYFLTHFANATNDHQNNFLLGAGVVYHWSHR
jgi:outer membrane immunogenic protein